jgi:hypothetical protein
MIAVILILLGWIMLFVFGATTPSDRFVDEDGFSSIINFLGFLACWTWTNVLLLACLASLLGECAREVVKKEGATAVPRAGIARGFFIFLAAATGQLVIVGQVSLPPTFADAAGSAAATVVTPGQYFRVATSCSLIAFAASVSPELLRSMLDAVTSLLESRGGSQRA